MRYELADYEWIAIKPMLQRCLSRYNRPANGHRSKTQT
jgi:hypothetical protein